MTDIKLHDPEDANNNEESFKGKEDTLIQIKNSITELREAQTSEEVSEIMRKGVGQIKTMFNDIKAGKENLDVETLNHIHKDFLELASARRDYLCADERMKLDLANGRFDEDDQGIQKAA